MRKFLITLALATLFAAGLGYGLTGGASEALGWYTTSTGTTTETTIPTETVTTTNAPPCGGKPGYRPVDGHDEHININDDCCLDVDANDVCDKYEGGTTTSAPVPPVLLTTATEETTTSEGTTSVPPPVFEEAAPATPAKSPRSAKPPLAGPGTDVSEPTPAKPHTSRRAALPFTGSPLGGSLLLGTLLLGTGLLLRRRAGSG